MCKCRQKKSNNVNNNNNCYLTRSVESKKIYEQHSKTAVCANTKKKENIVIIIEIIIE